MTLVNRGQLLERGVAVVGTLDPTGDRVPLPDKDACRVPVFKETGVVCIQLLKLHPSKNFVIHSKDIC